MIGLRSGGGVEGGGCGACAKMDVEAAVTSTKTATSGVRCVMWETSYNRGLMSSWRRVTCCALVAVVAWAADSAAQTGLATLSFSITLPDRAAAVGARIEVA